jgi:hypothetical protein
MSLSRGQLSSRVLEERFLRKAVVLEIKQMRPKSQILAIFKENIRPRIEAIFDELAYVCPKCFIPYLRQSDLTSHISSHS